MAVLNRKQHHSVVHSLANLKSAICECPWRVGLNLVHSVVAVSIRLGSLGPRPKPTPARIASSITLPLGV